MAKLPTIEQMKFRRYPPLKSGPPILWPSKRYFRRNEGSTDYATIPEVTLAGDQRWEFDILTTEANARLFLSGSEAGDRWYIGIQNGKLLIGNGVDRVIGETTIGDGMFHSIVWEVLSGVVTATVDGVVQYSSALLATLPYSISNIMASESGGTISSGILANLKIYDSGTLVRDYPLDDNSDTILDKANGQNGTIINGNADDWGLFDRQADGDWLGQELVVNGGFDSADGWTLGGNWDIAGGEAIANEVSNTLLYRSINATGGMYLESLEVTSYTSGRIQISSGGAGTARDSVGVYSEERLSSGDSLIRLAPSFSSGFIGSIDNVSVKEVLKNA